MMVDRILTVPPDDFVAAMLKRESDMPVQLVFMLALEVLQGANIRKIIPSYRLMVTREFSKNGA